MVYYGLFSSGSDDAGKSFSWDMTGIEWLGFYAKIQWSLGLKMGQPTPKKYHDWLVVSNPLKNISKFPRYGKIKMCQTTNQ